MTEIYEVLTAPGLRKRIVSGRRQQPHLNTLTMRAFARKRFSRCYLTFRDLSFRHPSPVEADACGELAEQPHDHPIYWQYQLIRLDGSGNFIIFIVIHHNGINSF